MSLFEEVDSLQREWTDRFVQVDGSVAELRRFAGLTGQVKTVNMSGQALVEFDGSEDIGWYDIHPQFLTVVEVEVEQEVEAETAEATPAEVADEAPTAATAATAPEAAPAADTSKLSPLELARMQDVGGAAAASASVSVSVSKTPAAKKEAAEKAPAAAAPAKQKPAAPKAADTSKLSPLELARMQDVGGDAPAPAAAAEDEAVVEETPAEDEEVAEEVAVEEETTAEETAADDSPATSVEIPEDEGPERTAAVLAACRAQDG